MTKDTGCRACRAGTALDFEFTMAFQPILDLADERLGLRGAGARPERRAGLHDPRSRDRRDALPVRSGRPRQGDRTRRTAVPPRQRHAAVDQLHAERRLRAECLHPRLAGGGAARRLRAPAHHVRVHRAGAVPRYRARQAHRRRLPAAGLPDRPRRFRRRLRGPEPARQFPPRPDQDRHGSAARPRHRCRAPRDRVGRRRHRARARRDGARRGRRDRGGARRPARASGSPWCRATTSPSRCWRRCPRWPGFAPMAAARAA